MRYRYATIGGTALALTAATRVYAQEAGTGAGLDVAQIASWATSTPPDYGKGLILAAGGLVGALIVVFGLVGGTIPGTAGKAQLDLDRERLTALEDQLSDALRTGGANPNLAELRHAANDLRDDLNRERYVQFVVGGLLYLILGAVIAALLAQDILQSFVIGAGWTGLVGTLGLRSDYSERKAEKDATIDRLSAAIERLANVQAPTRHRPAPTRRRRAVAAAPATQGPRVQAPDTNVDVGTSGDVRRLLADAAVSRGL